MRFLVDNQLPPALARFLTQELDVQAIHVSDVGLREATDLEIWRFATAEDLILASKDDDFLTVFSKAPTARLLWVRPGNCRADVPLRNFSPVLAGDPQPLHARRTSGGNSLIVSM